MSNGRAWSAADSGQLRRLAASGMSDSEIGATMGRDRDVIGRKRRELRLEPGRSAKLGAMMARLHYRRMART